MSLVSH